MTTRRAFIGTAVAGTAGALLNRLTPALRGQSGDSRLEILVNEPIGPIAPEIYSHFVEHLGGVVYDGVWVGEGSKVPNVGGVRRALVEHLQRIKPGVIRWPGGCFADSYDWHDGTGPRAEQIPLRACVRHLAHGDDGINQDQKVGP